MGRKRKNVEFSQDTLPRWKCDSTGAMTTERDGEWVRFADIEPLFAAILGALGECPDEDPVDAVRWFIRRFQEQDEELMDVVGALNEAGAPHNVKRHRKLVILDLAGRVNMLRAGINLRALAAWDEARKDLLERLEEVDLNA